MQAVGKLTDRNAREREISQPAARELVALAAAMRPEWDHDALSSAFVAAKNAGWTWTRTFTETARLLTDPDGSPWDLKRAAASPMRRERPQPGTSERGAALARELLEARAADR
jgi:uncharacterized membrane protein